MKKAGQYVKCETRCETVDEMRDASLRQKMRCKMRQMMTESKPGKMDEVTATNANEATFGTGRVGYR